MTQNVVLYACNKVSAGQQPRKGLSELIPEFRLIEVVNFANLKMEKGDKEVDRWIEGGVVNGSTMCKIGRAWTPEQFVQEAKKLKHPFDRSSLVPPAVAEAIHDSANLGPDRLTFARQKSLDWYTARRDQLESAESVLHASLDSRVELIVANKKILLFKEMLRDINYDDMAVVDLLIAGTKVVGTLERVGIWRPANDEAVLSIKALCTKASGSSLQKAALKPGAPSPLDKTVWDLTLEEAESKSIRGPLSIEEVESRVGKLWIAARRFPIKQGAKVRPIDDFSACFVNKAFGVKEKISLKSVDSVVCYARAWANSLDDAGAIRVTDTTGTVWQTMLSEDWHGKVNWTDLHGRVADLKSAYKQLPAHPAHACFGLIAVKDPVANEVRLFETLSLMFGQTAAVYAFLRFSRALSALALKLLWLVSVEFFDDFIQVEPAATAKDAQEKMESLLTLLGWQIASDPEKRKPFADMFVALGVMISFESAKAGEIALAPKPGRVDGIREQMELIIQRGDMDFKEALSIKGKLNFAESHVFCRVGSALSRLLSKWPADGVSHKLTAELVLAMETTARNLSSVKPKLIPAPSSDDPVLVFTDGACEEDVSVGGLLIAPGHRIEHFGATLSPSTVESFKIRKDQKQVIGQAEILPVLMAKMTWARILRGRKVIFFIDNEAARLGLVKSYSPVLPSLELIMKSAMWDYENDCKAW